ncbi:hypothetical protein Scep_027307 [Stephania cephalantha]|uniref:Bromo domain-containing protein n=1 Tax=Stephania cephalantha TaxID=152367 RepID=A0AAP0E7N5_9MAGN
MELMSPRNREREFGGFDGDYYVLKGLSVEQMLGPRKRHLHGNGNKRFKRCSKELHLVVPVEMINLDYCKKITRYDVGIAIKVLKIECRGNSRMFIYIIYLITSISIGCKLLDELDVKKCHILNMKRTPMKFIQVSSMPIDENITLKKNLKFIQLSSSMPIDENITLKKNLKLKVKLPQPKSQVENITVKKKLKLIKVKLPRARSQLDKSIEFEHERPISGSCKNGSLVKYTGKRGAETRLCGQKLKKLKIGSGVMQQCGALLRKLMNHEFGFLFNQPVKPWRKQIPDYFDIISEPMDLGTLSRKS